MELTHFSGINLFNVKAKILNIEVFEVPYGGVNKGVMHASKL